MTADSAAAAHRKAAIGPNASVLVGRTAELAALSGVMVDRCAVVLIEGEAGIGKTRLVQEFLPAADVQSLTFQCPPLPEPFPLGPIIDSLRRACGERVARMELTALAGVLRPLYPEWAAFLPPAPEPLDDARAIQHRLFRALDELMAGLGAGLIVVEDAHWADRATLEFLIFRWSQTERPGVLILTFRPGEIAEPSLLRRLGAFMPGNAQPLRMLLKPLTIEQVRTLVSNLLGFDSVSLGFAAFLHRHTGGLPFVVEETIQLLRNRVDVVHRDGGWMRRVLEKLGVPATMRDSTTERVDRLNRPARQLLNAAAVLARPSDDLMLTKVAGLASEHAVKGLDQAVTSGLLREVEPGYYQLRHALAEKAIYEAIPASTRRILHEQAIDVLKRLEPVPVAELAQHCKYSGDMQSWASYAERSADHAEAIGDDHTVVLLLHDILSNAKLSRPKRVSCGIKLAEVAARGGNVLVGERITGIIAQLSEILTMGNVARPDRGRIRFHLGYLLLQHGDPDEGRDQIRQSIDELADVPALAARGMLLLCDPWAGGRLEANYVNWLDRARALLPRVESKADRLALTAKCAIAQLDLGLMSGWETAAQLPDEAETPLEKRQLASGYANLACLALVWGRHERVEIWTDTADRLAGTAVLPGIRSNLSLNRAWLRYRSGRWSGLSDQVDRLVSTAEMFPLDRLDARILQGVMMLATGDIQTGQEILTSAFNEFQGSVYEDITLTASAALARLKFAEGSPQEALRLLQGGMSRIVKAGLWTWAADIAPVHVEALIRTDALADAIKWVGRMEAGLKGRDAPASIAALLVCQALIAEARAAELVRDSLIRKDHDRVAKLYSKAAHAWARVPRPYDELLALERQAMSLLKAGDREPGLALLTNVEQRFGSLGARWDADRIALLLRQHDVEVQRIWKRGRKGYGDQLSPRELDVVRLIAKGCTNKQIAERLFLTPRTVAGHVHSAMRKFNVGSRTALALAVTHKGLLTE